MDSNNLLIKNIVIYDYQKQEVNKVDIYIEGKKIAKIDKNIESKCKIVIDGRGKFILPGIIDVHSDVVENMISPKRNMFILNESILQQLLMSNFVCGITTSYQAIAYSYEPGIRNSKYAIEFVKVLEDFRQRNEMAKMLNINLRIEMTSNLNPLIQSKILNKDCVSLVSICDHSVGNSQHWDEEKFSRYLSERAKMSSDSIKNLICEMEKNRRANYNKFCDLLNKYSSRKRKICLHDIGKVEDTIVYPNFDIAEFPTNEEIINWVLHKNKGVVMGAPNIYNGKSINGNVMAYDICRKDKCTILCSDYSRETMLPSITLLSNGDLDVFMDYYKLVSLNPAEYLNFKKGKVCEGYDADLILVSDILSKPKIEYTICGGKIGYGVFT